MGIVQYYRCVWVINLHVLAPLIEVARIAKGRKIIFNNKLGVKFKDLKLMVFYGTLLNYPYWKILFALHSNSSENNLGAVISQIKNSCITLKDTYKST